MSFHKNGNLISGNDIAPYLGAVAQIIVIHKDDKDFLHVHPTSNEKFAIQGETRFDKPGMYRLPDRYFINTNHYSVKTSAALLFTFDKGQRTNPEQHGNTTNLPRTPFKRKKGSKNLIQKNTMTNSNTPENCSPDDQNFQNADTGNKGQKASSPAAHPITENAEPDYAVDLNAADKPRIRSQ